MRADSSACISSDSSKRRSAGTTFPASSTTTSPGTSSGAATVAAIPSRITCASGAAISRKAATARSARNSCTVPITALSSTITRIAIVSCGSPINPEITAATSNTTIMKSANCARKIPGRERTRDSGILFGPYSIWRCCATALPKPCSLDSRLASTSSASIQCQSACCTLFSGKQINQYDCQHGNQQGA